MRKEAIKLTDWQRILIGDAPVEFMLEVLVRTIIMYLALLIVVRLLGKRMSGQLSLTETAVMITLGAIVSAPMQIPDRGICIGIVALTCALVFQRGVNLLGIKSSKMETLLQGESNMLVKDGVMQLDEMKKTRFTKQELFAALRRKNIYNMGNVKRVYLEASGLVSIFEAAESKPGLSVLPENDDGVHCIQQPAGEKILACNNCGCILASSGRDDQCSNCHHLLFSIAVIN